MKLIIPIGLIALLFMTEKTQAAAPPTNRQPRGIRNNNPLNIRYNAANDWQGQTGTDGEYAIFSKSKYGIRAAAKLLNKYYQGYGLTTINEIINRWAPTIENNTSAYINAVANKLNVSANEPLLWPTYANALIKAMIHHENGMQPYTDSQINEGIVLAGI